ncbi:MAG: DNA cytosine methyltransferase [Spirochaetaceae bacterium]|nr:DNA cytosine methyltransferase [Spirochaetaceae bacterium]
MKHQFNIVDMFCGAGGESTGIMRAALEKDLHVRLTAINHWERAIETHAANHPDAEHLCESVEHIDPARAVRGGRVDLLWASPECTHHSVARGGRPRSEQSRASAWMVLKWLSELYVERVIIENVPEFLTWGPLDEAGRPIQSQKGRTFRAFIAGLRSLRYSVDWRILTAADYGDPTTRKRLFIQAVKGRKKIVWPEITHLDGGANPADCEPWKTARDIIDWSLPGESIFNRKRPLAEATMRRIAAGIEKYWGEYATPFLAVLYGSSGVRSIDLPLPTVTTSGAHHALVAPVLATEPFILPNEGYYRGNKAQSIGKPLGAVTASRGYGALISPFITRYHGSHRGTDDGDKRNHDIGHPLPALDTSNRYGLVSPFLIDNHTAGSQNTVSEPLRTITTKGWFGLISGERHDVKLDIRLRMLKPHELKRAQGFPADYRIFGTIAEQTKQIGNAVPVNTARALALAALGV